jgi:soluble lytic murein transglycosylase
VIARFLLFGLIATIATGLAPPSFAAAPQELVAATPPPLPANRQSNDLEKAFAHLKSAQWTSAQQRADGIGDPVASKLITWFVLTNARSRPALGELAAFIDANPKWPRRDYLLVRAENILVENNDDGVAISDWRQ